MNASKYMDKQIMELSRSKSSDFLDLINPQSEDEQSSININKDQILASYDFQPISRPTNTTTTPVLHSLSSDLSSKSKSSPLRSYNSVDHVEPDKIILEKSQKVNESATLSEIDRTVKIHIDSVLHAIDGLSARLSQLENRSRHLEHSVDELKVSIGNNHGSSDGKMRQLENILLEVQNGVQDIKDKQEVMEGHMQLAKLQIKVEQPSELSSTVPPDQQQTSASAPPQQPGFQQFSITPPQQVPSLPSIPSNMPPPPPSQPNIHPPPATGNPQFPPTHSPSGPHQDTYFSPPSQTQEVPGQQYQIPPPAQYSQPPPPPQQPYQSTPIPPYPQPPPSQPPQQQHPAIGPNPTQFSAPLGHRPEEGPYIPPQTYPPNLHQPASQPSSTPPHSQPYYSNPPSAYEPPPPSRPISGPLPSYGPPSGLPSELYPYGRPSHYGSGSSTKMQPHSPVGNSSSNYPQLPTAKILPSAIPTASSISGGPSSGGSGGNRVPIDDVVDKVTNMGFPRDHVRATVRRLTENGQSVDLNVVLDKLMNDGDIQPPKGWFNR